MARPHTCPYCKSTKTHWKGNRQRTDGAVRLRYCNTCKRKFTTKTMLTKKKTRKRR